MEATKELETSGVLNKIIPPQLEDSVLRAAAAAKSRATAILTGEEGGDCVNDPWPDPPADVLTGVQPEHDVLGPCAGEKGGQVEVGVDDVVVPDVGGAADEVVVGAGVDEGEKRGACVDGLQGVEDGVEGRDRPGGDTKEVVGGDDNDDEDEPSLVEGVV